MKIIIISELAAGGVERVNYLLAKALGKDNQVLTIAIKGTGKEYISDINYICLNKTSGKKAIPKLIKEINNFRPDWIVCCDHTSTFCAIFYKTVFNRTAKVMFVAHSVYSSMFLYKPKRKLIFQHYMPKIMKLYNKCDAVIYVSNGVKQDFKALYNVRSQIEYVIYNPVFIKMPDVIKKSHLIDEPIKLVTVGRLEKEKRQALQIEVVSNLLEKGYKAELYIYGQGECKAELEKKAMDLGIEKYIHFMGFNKEVVNEISKYDLFCLTSEFESFGNVLVEAMSIKLPVISVDCPYGPAEILKDGKYGMLVSDNIQDISEKIISVFENGYNVEMIEMAYIRALEFELDNVVKQYMRAMKQ